MDAPGFTPQPFEPQVLRPGLGGVVLAADPELLSPDEARVLDNWRRDVAGQLEIRPGGTLVLSPPTAGAPIHTLARLYRPSTGDYVNFIGAVNTLYRGVAAFEEVSGGVLSGDPLTLLPYRPAISGDPWMIVADRNVMGQVPAAGVTVALGLPAPATPIGSAIADILTTNICSFEGATGAGNWTLGAGPDRSDVPVTAGVPSAADVPGLQNTCVAFTTNPGAAASGYASVMGISISADLTQLQGGFRPSPSEDLVHLFIRINRPGLVEEVKVYFVCSSGFSAGIVPGQDETLNTDAFVKSFAPSEFTGFVEGLQPASDVARQTEAVEATTDYLESVPDHRTPESQDAQGPLPQVQVSGTDQTPASQLPQTFVPGRNVWTEYGTVGRPLRKSDFTRIGNTANRGWNTITGIVIVVQTLTNQPVTVSCDDWYITGGYGLDTTEPGTQGYDYRYTHVHLDTGDESNPSPIQAEDARQVPKRQRIRVQPTGPFAGAGAARVRQRFYRRGGTLNDDWYYLGQNTANGAEFVDELGDLEVAASSLLEIDNFQPVPTVDSAGALVLAQSLAAVWGPLDGKILGCGDARRPGYLYASKTNRPGSWPPDLATEVCSPSEQLMHGFVYGGQGFVFSRRRLFAIVPNLNDGTLAAQDTPCQKGLAGRWAWVLGPQGCFFISDDGIYLTTGGAAQEVSQAIRTYWMHQQSHSYPGIDLSQETELRLFLIPGYLVFQFRDLAGNRQLWVRHHESGAWMRDTYASENDRPGAWYWDRENAELPPFYGTRAGLIYAYNGTSDNGTAIVGQYASGLLNFRRPREEKLLGDLVVQTSRLIPGVATAGVTLDGVEVLAPVGLPGDGSNQQRMTIDPSGGAEKRARVFQVSATWTQNPASPAGRLHQMQLSAAPLAEETYKRIGQWEPLGKAGGYLTGLAITCDTSINKQPDREGAPDASQSILVEYTRNGVTASLGPYTLTAAGRRTIHLSWLGVIADQVRIVPQQSSPWMLYHLEWQVDPEPGLTSTYDSNEDVKGDTYCTGLDLVLRSTSAVVITPYIDGVALPVQTVASTGGAKRLVHLTIEPPRYGHVYRFTGVLQDGAQPPFSLYSHEWILQQEPGEQINWNQNFTIGGTLTDKWIKGVLLECDTQGINKIIDLEVDGTIVQTFTVNAAGRQVVHVSFEQVRGRVLRLRPQAGTNQATRLWSVQWIFDEEPLGLTRWETQPLDHGQSSWHSMLELDVEYRSTAQVVLRLRGYNDRNVMVFDDDYFLESTAGEKRKINVPVKAHLAVHWKYTFTSTEPCAIYREGSRAYVLPLGAGGEPIAVQPFGNDDLDRIRAMGNASSAAATPNTGVRG